MDSAAVTVPQIMDITSLFDNSGLIDTQLHSFVTFSKNRLYPSQNNQITLSFHHSCKAKCKE